MNTLTQKRTHFPRTTASQRKLLFQTWQATGDVELACRKAHVSEGTYYKWKPRFERAGYQALERFASHAPKTPQRTPQAVEQKVIDLRRKHPKWGKRRIADEMAKDNNWVPLVSPNTVRRILIDACLWQSRATPSDSKKPVQARTADKPAQTLNIDLCFVPATRETHEVVSKLPAVSGSSGRLVVERTLDQAAKEEPTWPGRVFEQQNLTYEQAMDAFVDASANKSSLPSPAKSPEAIAAATVLEQKRQIRQEEETLRAQRRTVRQKRQLEDQAWVAIRDQRRAQQAVSTPMAPQTDLTVPQTGLIEPKTDLIEPQTDSVRPQTDSIAQATDLLEGRSPAVSQQADSITQQTELLASEQDQSYDAQISLTDLTSRPAALVDPVSLANDDEPAASATEQDASLSLAAQPTPSQATEGPPQTTSVGSVVLATESVVSVGRTALLTAQQATSVAQPATLAMRQIASTMRLAPPVTQPTTPVAQPTTPVAQPTTPVAQPTTPVAQPVEKKEAAEASQGHISDSQWRQIKSARKMQKEQRKKEDVQWRQKRNSILQQLGELPLITAWVAILVIVDNCTRQCISLPLFMVGPHVTAQMIVEALRDVLPAELQYLISDRGVHFRANIFTQFCQMSGFQHVLIAKHRPQSNGIAERFVRTLKEWLADKSWTSEEELIALLTEFREYYNDRPHQGIAMPGLSPNEYAKRIWVQ